MNLGGRAAPGPSEGLARLRVCRIRQFAEFVPGRLPLLRAPAAGRWAWLIVEPADTVRSTAPTASSLTCTYSSSAAQVPSASQRANRS